jgi:hypothetical protein
MRGAIIVILLILVDVALIIADRRLKRKAGQ